MVVFWDYQFSDINSINQRTVICRLPKDLPRLMFSEA